MLLLSQTAGAFVVQKSLYIYRGELLFIDSLAVPSLHFSEKISAKQEATFFKIIKSDTLRLSLVNLDSIPHQFTISESSINFTVAKGDTHVVDYVANNPGLFSIHSIGQNHRYLGIAAFICVVREFTTPAFTWQIRDHQSNWHNALYSGQNKDWSQYEPDYFTINYNSNPDIQKDSSAVIRAKVGDTVRIYVANEGMSIHSFHFHGFHSKIIFHSNRNYQVGWIKDTFPLHPQEAFVLEMVPDKPGYYPVHDHNLIAVTGGGKYPNGIFLIMEISP